MDQDLLTRRLSDFMMKITTNHIEGLVLGLKYQSRSKSIRYVRQDQIPGKSKKKPKNKSFNTVASNIMAAVNDNITIVVRLL